MSALITNNLQIGLNDANLYNFTFTNDGTGNVMLNSGGVSTPVANIITVDTVGNTTTFLGNIYAPNLFEVTGNISPTYSLNFNYGDVSPELIANLPAGSVVSNAKIIILTPFNGSGATLSVGDAIDYTDLMAINSNDPSIETSFQTNPGYKYISATNTYISITPGIGATQGSGIVTITLT